MFYFTVDVKLENNKMDKKRLIIFCMILSAVLALPAMAAMENMNDMGMNNTPADTVIGDAHAMGGINWLVIALFLGVIAVAGYFASNTEKLRKINFLEYPSLKSLLKSRWYPLIFVAPTFIIFSIIVYQLFFGSVETSYNFGAVMVWILLWPILPVLFLLFGRLWCSVCPLSRVSDEVQKKVGLHRKVPKFLQNYGVWIIIIAFLIITWLDSIVGIVESPINTGYLLLFVFLGAVFMGAIFEKRAWCRYLCFLGGLSSNYSMSSALELRTNGEVCKTCKTPVCYKGTDKLEGCSMFEYPRTMASNRFCNFCSNCIKSCPHDAIRITPRAPTSELWFINKPRFDVSFLATALIGIVISQTIVMLEVWEPFMTWFENTTGITNFPVAWTLIFAGAMLIPIVLMLAASLVSRNTSWEMKRSNFIRFGYALIPLGLGIHLAHNAKHFLGEGLSVIYTSASLVGLNITGDMSILNMPTIQVIQYILSILGIIGGVYTAHRIAASNPDSKASALPYIIVILLFGLIALWMYSIPMGARAH
jgi:polyferredoxin